MPALEFSDASDITNDTLDFMSLISREHVHPGLVCLEVAPGSMSLEVQRRLFAIARDRLGDSEPINEVLHELVEMIRIETPGSIVSSTRPLRIR
jgi:hypothetical protein